MQRLLLLRPARHIITKTTDKKPDEHHRCPHYQTQRIPGSRPFLPLLGSTPKRDIHSDKQCCVGRSQPHQHRHKLRTIPAKGLPIGQPLATRFNHPNPNRHLAQRRPKRRNHPRLVRQGHQQPAQHRSKISHHHQPIHHHKTLHRIHRFASCHREIKIGNCQQHVGHHQDKRIDDESKRPPPESRVRQRALPHRARRR